MEFYEDGDKELWLLSGDTWCIPIFAFPRKAEGYERVWFLEPAMSMDKKAKFDKFCSVVNPVNMAKDKNYIVKEEDLKKIATKAPGITPRYYSKWDDRVEREPAAKAYDQDEIYKETLSSYAEMFLKFVHEETQVADIGVIKLVYMAMRKAAPVWLLEKKRPLDLGFCRIHAFPLRDNWKVFMDVWMPHSLSMINKRADVARAEMINAGFGENLCDPLVLSVDEVKRHINWSLDIEALPSFNEESVKMERARRSALGDVKYYNWVKTTIADMFNPIFDVYARWTKTTNQANGEIRGSFRTSAEILFPVRKRVRNRPENNFRLKSYSKRSDWLESNVRVVEAATKRPPLSLPPMPDLQPQEGDVRDGGQGEKV